MMDDVDYGSISNDLARLARSQTQTILSNSYGKPVSVPRTNSSESQLKAYLLSNDNGQVGAS